MSRAGELLDVAEQGEGAFIPERLVRLARRKQPYDLEVAAGRLPGGPDSGDDYGSAGIDRDRRYGRETWQFDDASRAESGVQRAI